MGARIVVLARHAFTQVLSADARNTDAGNAVEAAVCSVDHRSADTLSGAPPTITTAKLAGAFVAIVGADDTVTRLGLEEWIEAPHGQHDVQHADKQKSERPTHDNLPSGPQRPLR
jgi:hypothetical protein